MKTVNIGNLKNKLSAYLQDVRNGEEVIVQDRKKPIARIVPISQSGDDDERARLIASGDLKPALEKMDWEAFWRHSAGDVSREAALEATSWAKGDR